MPLLMFLLSLIAAHRTRLGAVVVLALLCMPTAFAADIQLRAPYVASQNGVYVLNTELMFDTPELIERAIREGATLNMDMEIRVRRARAWWRDVELANLQQRYALLYHSVSERFLVRNLNSGAQASYAAFAQAIDSLHHIENLPVVDQALVMPDSRNEISLRVELEVRSIPRVLGLLLFWVDDFTLESDWYTWPMKS